MPKDKRLYMTFPIDVHRHPKIMRLSVEARWCFVELNGEARLADNDGVFDAAEAEYLWPADLLAQLCDSHPTKPLLVRDGDTYVIREYAAHQHTKADREALTSKRVEAGKVGAAKRWQTDSTPMASAKQVDSKPIASAKQVDSKPWQGIAESESESQSELQLPRLNTQSYVNTPPTSDLTDDEIGQLRIRKNTYSEFGINNPAQIQALITSLIQREVNEFSTFLIVMDILSRAKEQVKNGQRYVASSIKQSWAEIQKNFDLGLYGGDAA